MRAAAVVASVLLLLCGWAAARNTHVASDVAEGPLVFEPSQPVGRMGASRLFNLNKFFDVSHRGLAMSVDDLEAIASFPRLLGNNKDKSQEIVTFQQKYKGVPIVGAQAKVVFDRFNRVLKYSGKLIPNVALDVEPTHTAEAAASRVLFVSKLAAAAEKSKFKKDMQLFKEPELKIYRTGMSSGFKGENLLVWEVTIVSASDASVKYLFRMNAHTMELVNFNNLIQTAVNRELRNYPSTTPFWVEGDPWPSDFDDTSFLSAAGDYYATLDNMFGWKSYDNKDSEIIGNMRMDTNICPNAYWDPSVEMMFFCTNLSRFDVATHELGHALTSNLDNGIYEYASGALQEAFSDTIAETFSQFWNGSGYYPPRDPSRSCVDTMSGTDSKLWIVGDDCDMFDDGLRDMYNPECYDLPAQVSDMVCYPFDEDGVHSNCGPPSVLYAVLASGGVYNGQTFTGISTLKAWHIFFAAKYEYQTSTETFAEYAQHLQMGCSDLIDQTEDLVDQYGKMTDLHIQQSDCDTLSALLTAVGMEDTPCTTYTFWGAYPQYVPTTGGVVPVYTAGQSTKEYLKVGSTTLEAANTFYNPYGSTSGWNYVAKFEVPSYSKLGLSTKTNVPFTLAHDSAMTQKPITSPYSLPMTLTFFDMPTISSISPSSGAAAGGYAVTVTGTNFQYFNGPCGILTDSHGDCLACLWMNGVKNVAGTWGQFVDANTIKCVAPGGDSGSKWRLAITLNQNDFSNFVTFTYK